MSDLNAGVAAFAAAPILGGGHSVGSIEIGADLPQAMGHGQVQA